MLFLVYVVVNAYVGDVVDGSSGTVEFGGDVLSSDVVRLAGGVKVMVEGRVRRGVKLEEVLDTMTEGMDGTEGVVTGHSMSKGLTMCAVLLVSVGKEDVGPLLHIIQRAVTGRDTLDEGTTEGGVGKVEGLAAAMVGSRGEGVLTWAAEEEESKGGQVKDGLGSGLVMVLGKAGDEGTKDGDVDWPHLGGSGVLIGPSFEEGLELEGVMDAVQAGIQ